MATPPLTEAQKVIFRDDIAADPVLGQLPQISESAQQIVDAYNLDGDPRFWIWRERVHKHDFTHRPGPEGTTFIWVGNGFIGRSVPELITWQELFDAQGYVDTRAPNLRQAFTDIFSGTGNAASNRAHCGAVARRPVSRFEALYTTGAGTAAAPGDALVLGPCNLQDVYEAWGA